MLRACKEVEERGSKAMMLQAECERLEKEAATRRDAIRDLDEQLAAMRSGKAFKDLEAMKKRVAAEVEASTKTKELMSRMVYSFDEQEREKREWEQAIRECDREHAEVVERVQAVKAELKDIEKRLAARKRELAGAV